MEHQGIPPLSVSDQAGVGLLVIGIIFTIVSIVITVVVYLPAPNPLTPIPTQARNPTAEPTVPGLDTLVTITVNGTGTNTKFDGVYTVTRYSSVHDEPAIESDGRRNCYFQPPDLTVTPQALVWAARYAPTVSEYPVFYWKYNGNPALSRFDMLVYIQGTSLNLGVANQYVFFYNIFLSVAPSFWPMTQLSNSLIWAYNLPNFNSLDPEDYEKCDSVVTYSVEQIGRLGHENRITSGVMNDGSTFEVAWPDQSRPASRPDTRPST